MLGAARDLRLDPELVELLGQVLAGLVDVALALGALLGDELLDLVVLARMERLEGEILELPLDRVDTEAVRDRRVDVERLARLLDLLLLRHRRDRAHVVQAVGELDQDDPDVRGHRDHHLAVVLGLGLVARLERQPGQLGDAVDESGDLLAERLADLLERRADVSSTVSCSSAAHSVSVSSRMPAQIFATPTGWMMKSSPAAPPLVGVVDAGVDERLLDPVAVDRDRRLVARAPRRSRTGRRAGAARRRSSSARRSRPAIAGSLARERRGARWSSRSRAGCRVAVGTRRLDAPAGRCGLSRFSRSEFCRRSGIAVRPRIVVHTPVGRRALERRGRVARDRQGRQIPVEADELQLRENPDQPAGQACRPAVPTVTTEQSLELLAGYPPLVPEAPVEGGERSAETVLQLVYLLCKA